MALISLKDLISVSSGGLGLPIDIRQQVDEYINIFDLYLCYPGMRIYVKYDSTSKALTYPKGIYIVKSIYSGTGKPNLVEFIEDYLHISDKVNKPLDNPTLGNFVSFDDNGNAVDSNCNTGSFAPMANAMPLPQLGDEGKILGYEAPTEGANPVVGWVEKPVDGDDAYHVWLEANGYTEAEHPVSEYNEYNRGKSAREIYNATYNKNLNDAEFAAELKMNYPMLHVGYDSTNAGATIGVPFSGNLDPTGDNIGASETTMGKLYLMPDAASDPLNCIGFVTVLDGTYKWCNVGAIRIPSDVLAKSDVDDECVDGATDEPASAKAVMDLKAKLEGVTASETKVAAVVGTNVTTGKYVSGEDGLLKTPGSSASSYAYLELFIPNGTKAIRFLAGTKTSGAKLGYSIGYYDEANDNVYVPTRYFYFDNATTPTTNVEKTIKVEEGETVFMATCAGDSDYTSITLDSFYCYLQSGESVRDEIQKIENDIDDIELFRQDYEQYEEVDMNKSIYKTVNHFVNYNGSVESNDGWSYIKTPVSGYEKVRFLGPIRTASATQGYCFKDVNDDYIDNSGHRYSVGDTAGTEDLTVDVPEGAYWFYTNYRFDLNPTFTSNFYIKLIKGDTLKSIIDDAKKDCTDYTDEQVTIIEGQIEDIQDAITVSEEYPYELIPGYGGFTWQNGWRAYTKIIDSNKKNLRVYDNTNGTFGIYFKANTTLKCPVGCTLRHSDYGIKESTNVYHPLTPLAGGQELTLNEDTIMYITFQSTNNLWDVVEGEKVLTELGSQIFEYFTNNIEINVGTLSDKIDEVENRLVTEIDKVKNEIDSKVILPTIEKTTAIDYHAALDYLCYDSASGSDNKNPWLLRSEPEYLRINESGVTTEIENENYPLYTYTLNAQLMYMFADGHLGQGGYIGSSGNGYQVYAPKKENASSYLQVIKPYYYYTENNLCYAGNYLVSGVNNGIFYNNNIIKNGKKKILVVSGVHGDEYGAPLGLYEFIVNLLSKQEYADLLVNCEFTFVPIANPWGYNKNQRFRGSYDINRDFDDFNGFNTQEAIYIRNILKNTKYDMVIDLHQHDLTEKHGLQGGYTSFNCFAFETPTPTPENPFFSKDVLNNQFNLTGTGRKIANAVNEAGIRTDVVVCNYADSYYLQHSFVWITPTLGGNTLKSYASGSYRIEDGVSIGNSGGANSGQAAYISMTSETPIICSWSGITARHSIISRVYTNQYINNLLTTMCRKLVNGDFGEPNS